MKQDTISSQLPTSNELLCSIDLKQVLSLTFLTHSQMLYSHQLLCFNQCVHVGGWWYDNCNYKKKKAVTKNL